MKPGHSQRKHSEYGPSSADRWLNCPGSVRLNRLAPPQVESKYAREGTEAHECLEFLVRRYNALGSATAEAVKKWPAEMVAHCTNAAQIVYSLRPSPTAKLLIETRVKLAHVGKGIFGSLDYAWVEDWGLLIVIDFKYGAGVQVLPVDEDGELNPQLLMYASGVAHLHDYDFEKVQLAIIQPRVYRDGEPPLAITDCKIPELRKFEKRAAEAYKVTRRPDAPLNPGDHCRWCAAKPECPALQKQMVQADLVFDLEDGLQAVPEAKALAPRDLGKLLAIANQIEFWIEGVRERAKMLAEAGTEIPGFKLVAKRAQRVWLPDAEKTAVVRFGTHAFERSLLSPAKLEKALGKPGAAFTEEFTTAVSSGSNLVPASDKRSEVVNVTPFDFDEV